MEVKRRTCRQAAVYWCSDDPVYPSYWLVMLTRAADDSHDTVSTRSTNCTVTCFFYVNGGQNQLYLPLLLTAGSEYSISVAAMTHAFCDTYVPSLLVFNEGAMDFRAGTSGSRSLVFALMDMNIFCMVDLCGGVENTSDYIIIEKLSFMSEVIYKWFVTHFF